MPSPVSHRRIKLTPAFQTVTAPGISVFRFTLTASDAHELPDAIFAYREIPLQPGQASTVAVFDHVCSPVDLQEYPVGAPRVNADPPWFRLPSVDLECRTRAQALQTHDDLVADVVALINGMNAADVLAQGTPLWIGYTQAEAEGDGSLVGSEGSLN